MLQNLHFVLLLVVYFTSVVVFHELGHFLAAKFFKMRVLEFAIGFWKRVVRVGFDGETEYTIRALPVGGFVRIAGMEIEDAAEAKLTGVVKTTNEALLEQESEEVANIDPNGFNSRPVFQRFIVILAGPVFSFLLGWLVFCSVGMTIGFPDKSLFLIDDVVAKSPAAAAGLRSGDTILSIDNKPVDYDGAMATINKSIGVPLHLHIKDEDGGERNVIATPKSDKQPGEKVPVGRIGVVPDENPQSYHRVGPVQSIERGTEIFVGWFRQVGALVQSGKIKDSAGGAISIAKQVHTVAKRSGLEQLTMLGTLTLSIGLTNLLPIPIFDGGHLMLMLLELIRRRKLTAEQTGYVMMAGMIIIVLLVVIIGFKDVLGLIHPK